MTRPLPAALALLPALALAACGDPAYVDTAHPGTVLPWQDAVEYRVAPSWRQAPPDCIAILPLAADSKAVGADGAAIVRRAVYGHLAPQGRRFVPLERVDHVAAGLSGDAAARRRDLGRRLHCGAVLSGTVTDYSADFYGLYSSVSVGATLELRRADDGALLWQGRHVAHSQGGGVPLSPIGAAMGVMDAAVNLRDEEMLRVADDLARRLASTIPDDVVAAYDDPAAGPVRMSSPPASAASFLAGLAGEGAEQRRAALLQAVETRRFTGADGWDMVAALLAAAPGDARAQLAAGNWQLAEGDYAGAVAAADRAAALDPLLAPAYFLRGRVLLREREFDRAEPALLRAVALDRTNPLYLDAVGALNGERGETDRALAAYRLAVAADPGDAFAWYNAAVIHYNAGRAEQAAESFAAAGLAYARRGDPGRAEKAEADLRDLARQGVAVDQRIDAIQHALTASTRRET